MDEKLQAAYDALQAAHEAGNTADATQLADYIETLKTQSSAELSPEATAERNDPLYGGATGAVVGTAIGTGSKALNLASAVNNLAKQKAELAIPNEEYFTPGQKYSAKTGYGSGPGVTVEEVVANKALEKKPLGRGKVASKLLGPRTVEDIMSNIAQKEADAKMHARVMAQDKLRNQAIQKRLAQERLFSIPNTVGTTKAVTGATLGYNAMDMYNQLHQGDPAQAALSGVGMAGSVMPYIKKLPPKLRALGTGLSIGAPLANRAIDAIKGQADGGAVQHFQAGKTVLNLAGKAISAKAPLAAQKLFIPKTQKFSEAIEPFIDTHSLHPTIVDKTKLDLAAKRMAGPEAPYLQEISQPHKDSGWIFANDSLGAASKLYNMGKDGNTLITGLLGSPTQLKTNRSVFGEIADEYFNAIKQGKMTPELEAKIQARLPTLTHGAEKIQTFPTQFDIRDRDAFNEMAKGFHQRGHLADIMGGIGVSKGLPRGTGKIIPYDDILMRNTESSLLDAPTHSVGSRLFTVGDKPPEYRPDLHNAFDYANFGQIKSGNFGFVPKEISYPDEIARMQANLKSRGIDRNITAMDLMRNTIKQPITEQMWRRAQEAGYADGGSISDRANEQLREEYNNGEPSTMPFSFFGGSQFPQNPNIPMGAGMPPQDVAFGHVGHNIHSKHGRFNLGATGISANTPEGRINKLAGVDVGYEHPSGFFAKINKPTGGMMSPRFDVGYHTSFADGGEVQHFQAGKRVLSYVDPIAKKIADWNWKGLPEVSKKLNVTEIPDYIQGGYGEFMKNQAAKAANNELTPRDLLKAYTITQSSIGRGGLPYNTATKGGLHLPNTGELVRPEGAFAEWLGSKEGQRYLNMAEKGEIDPVILKNLSEKFAPFGKQNQLAGSMEYAAKTMPGFAQNLNKAVTGSKEDYRDWAEQLKGIAGAKSGFIGSMLGRGDLPTFDARQINLHTGNQAPVSIGSIMSRGNGLGAREAVDRLAARQNALDLSVDPSLAPHYQHLTHHAIWDDVANSKTTHNDLIDAMSNHAEGGSIQHFQAGKRVLNAAVNAIKEGVEPKEVVKAYKLFRTDPKVPNSLYPLFVNANEQVPLNKWVDATAGTLTDAGKVKSKIGDLAYRPGWHAGEMPVATHIGGKSDPTLKAPDYRPGNQVWAEVEMPNDVDWQTIANQRAQLNKAGKPISRTAHITDQLPEGGHYRYKTNPNMTGDWLIGGSMKVNKVLTDDEVKAINEAMGVSDLPRIEGKSTGGKVASGLTSLGKNLIPLAEHEAYKAKFTPGFYHGSPSPDIKSFDPTKSPRDPMYVTPKASFVTQDPKFAESFLSMGNNGRYKSGATMYPVSVNLGKHWHPDTPEGQQVIQDFIEKNPKRANLKFGLNRGAWTAVENSDFLTHLKNTGHDTFHVVEGGSNVGVLKPENIRGKFAEYNPEEAASPEIMKATGGEIISGLASLGKKLLPFAKKEAPGINALHPNVLKAIDRGDIHPTHGPYFNDMYNTPGSPTKEIGNGLDEKQFNYMQRVKNEPQVRFNFYQANPPRPEELENFYLANPSFRPE